MAGLRSSINFISSDIKSIDGPILFSQKGIVFGSDYVKQHGANAKIKNKTSRIPTNIRYQLFVVIVSNADEIFIYT